MGEREYSSNHFPWRMLARKGTRFARSRSETAASNPTTLPRASTWAPGCSPSAACRPRRGTGPTSRRSAASPRGVGAIVFVDGSQMVGAMPLGDQLDNIDVLAAPDHKYLLNAGGGVGYCYLSGEMQDRFTPPT